jgi:CheY-like chemotaxis protein
VAAAERSAFDLILMDLQMSDVDGVAATQAIRASLGCNARTPIVAISANVLPSQVAACLAAGMDDHIAKPINPAELVSKVGAWTADSAGRRPVAAE